MKKIISLALAFILLIGASACTATASKSTAPEASANAENTVVNPDETYVFLTPLANLEYWQAHRKGLEDACAELGVKASFVGDEKLDPNTMCAMLETIINDPNTAGIIMQGNFPDAYAPYYQMAWDKGIPVCNITIDVPNSKRLCFLGNDYVAYGAKMLDLAAEACGEKGDVIVSNNLTAGSSTVEDVMTGIRNQIAQYPNMKIVAEVDDKSDVSEAASKVGAALQANPNAAVVIGGQSTSAIGAVTAIKEAGLKDSVKVISIDRDEPTLEAIKAGDIYATVAGKQYSEVYYATKICYDFNHGSKKAFSNDDAAANLVVAPQRIDTGSLVITAENVDKFIGFKY